MAHRSKDPVLVMACRILTPAPKVVRPDALTVQRAPRGPEFRPFVYNGPPEPVVQAKARLTLMRALTQLGERVRHVMVRDPEPDLTH